MNRPRKELSLNFLQKAGHRGGGGGRKGSRAHSLRSPWQGGSGGRAHKGAFEGFQRGSRRPARKADGEPWGAESPG